MIASEDFLTSGRLKLRLHFWRAPPARGAILLLHGVNEHGARYERLALELHQAHLNVYAVDLRGHGLSDGEKALVLSFDSLLDDIDEVLAEVRKREGEKNLFLLGHSMGGALAAWYAIRRHPSLRGMILSAPAIIIGGRVFPVLRHAARIVSRVWPRLRLVRFGCSFVSRDPAAVAAFRNDPLIYHGRFPVRTGAEILRVANRILRESRHFNLPFLIQHGTGDVVTDYRGSLKLHELSPSTDKTIYCYPGLYHEIYSEPERRKVLDDLLEWIRARL